MNTLKLIGRDSLLFEDDLKSYGKELDDIVKKSKFLVIGGAGSIGSAVVKEIFKRNPKKLHVVDISENNLVELVRDIRSSLGYIDGEFKTFALDIGSDIYDAFIEADGEYDYVLNLSALKHVRSEKDPYTLMRMIDVNIFNNDIWINSGGYDDCSIIIENNLQEYFYERFPSYRDIENLNGVYVLCFGEVLKSKKNKFYIKLDDISKITFK